MSETKNKTDNESTDKKDDDAPKKKTLSLGTLSLKSPVSGGGAPASSGGVAVQVKRRRSSSAATPATPEPEKPVQKESPSGGNARQLTDSEREARIKALKLAEEAAQIQKEEDKKKAEEKGAEEAAAKEDIDPAELARQKELAELERIESEENEKRDEAKKKAEEDRKQFAPSGPADPTMESPANKHRKDIDRADREEEESYREKMKRNAAKKPRSSGERKRSGKLTVTQVLNEDYARDRGQSLAAQRRAREKARMAQSDQAEPPKKVKREVVVPETITVQELANRMAEPGGEVVKALMSLGVMVTINQTIDADTAELITDEFGHTIKRITDADIELGIEGDDDNAADLIERPPVVTIMGHVDHGKTSLLDALRATDVVAGEAGGITQHIGAYQVNMESGAKITFLDTPGHAAFTEMRSRGANVTDIVVIVVAANDSIMPQTIEAINHAKAAEVPIIIAINKVDLPDANPQKVKTDLLQHEIVVEDMSGDVLCVEVSAKQRLNLDKLEEMILLQSEVLELQANPNRSAVGTVVEAKLEQGRGNVATILVEKGTLHVGDIFVVGAQYGRVRALLNDHGKNVEEAIPGQPVEVIGLNGAPGAGDRLVVLEQESRAREISEYRQRKDREASALKLAQVSTFEHRLAAAREGDKQALSVIVKADVHGSAEALIGSLKKIEEENDDVIIRVLHSGVGGITESDTTLANASNALIIGFNVRANAQAREAAEREGIEIRYYNVIYNVIDDAKAVLSGMLAPTLREEYLGQAEIKEVFKVSKVGNIAGCIVTTGKVARGAKVRLLRDDIVIHEGTLKTLKRFKDEVAEVKEGTECGMAFENYDDIKAKDVIECYEVISEDRVLE